VGHLNRNIQIVAGPDAGWGYSVIVYGYRDSNNLTRNGTVQLVGVQFQDGGQLDSPNPPLMFYKNNNNISKSLVTASSFINCKAKCISISNSKNITIDGNVFYQAWLIGIEALTFGTTIIANNLIIGVRSSPTLA
jgi:hypothetical protein